MAIRVEIELDDGSFTTRMIRAGESVQQFQQNVGRTITSVNALQSTSSNFLGTLRDVTVTLGMASAAIGAIRTVTTGWAGDIVKVNAEFERLTTLMKGMSSAADPLKEAKQQVQELRDFARQTPYSLQALSDVFVKLRSGGLDPMKGSMQGLVNAVAAFGGSEEVMKRAALAIQQMSGKGVIQMEELRQQLGEAVPRATELMARSMGVTVGELVQKLSTGTVEARRGINLLQGELERTFGGAAQAQMQSWNGIAATIANSFQNLQLRVGGNETGFFQAVKDKAVELNDFLTSKSAGNFADALGSGLTTAIGVFDRVIQKVVQFKDEIISVGYTLAAGLGLSVVTSGLTTVMTALGNARAQWTAYQIAIGTIPSVYNNALAAQTRFVGNVGLMQTAWAGFIGVLNGGVNIIGSAAGAAANFAQVILNGMFSPLQTARTVLTNTYAAIVQLGTGFVTGANSLGTYVNALNVVRAGLAATRTAILATAVALAALAPVLVAVGAGISFAVSYFDLFGTKVKDAKKEVQELGGAAAKASLKLFIKDLQDQQKEIDALEKRRESVRTQGVYAGSAGIGPNARAKRLQEIDEELAGKRKTLADGQRLIEAAGAEFSTNLAQREADKKLKIFDEMIQSQRRQIDIWGTDMAKAQDEALADAAAKGLSTEKIRADYARRERERQLSIYDLEIAQREDSYEDLRAQLDRQSGLQREATERELDGQLKAINTAKQLREQLAKSQIEVPQLSKPLDEDKLYKKGQNALQGLKDSIAGVRAEMTGASKEVAELQSALAAGKYGPIDSGRVQELIKDLVAAQEEKKALDDLLEGKTKFDNDAASLELKLRQEIFEEQTRGMSEVDKWKAKINSGFYSGVGPGSSPLERSLVSINEGFTVATNQAGALARSVQQQLFGSETINSGNTFVGILKQAVEQIQRMRDGVGALSGVEVNIGGTTSSSANGGTIMPSGDGLTSGYLSRLIKQESGGNPNAKAATSSAVGLGQFIETTWMNFLRDMHPDEFRNMTKAQALALRTNSDMMKEAIVWYARENAAYLKKAGVTVNDATVYLAHFLGPQGAVKALRANDGASVSSVLPDAVSANAFLRGKDIGWLKNWANNKMGVSSTYAPQQANDSRLPTPTGLNAEQGATVERLTQLEQKLNALKVDNALADKVKELGLELRKTNEEATGTGSKLSKIDQAIRDGVFGKAEGQTNPMADRYKEIREEAMKVDAAEKTLAENRRLRSRLNSAVERNKTLGDDLDFKQQDIADRLKAENPLKLSESLYRMRFNQMRDEKAGEELIKRGDSNWSKAQQDQLVASNLESFTRSKDIEVQTSLIAEQKKNRDLERELMTADQRRQAMHDEEIARLQALVNETKEGTEARAQAEEALAKRQILARQSVSQSSPLGKQMKEWSSLGENMEKAMTGWLDSGVDALAEFVTTGKADFASLFQSIAKDITKMALKWALSGMFGGGGGQGGGLKSLLKGGGAAKGGGAKAGGAAGGGLKMFGAMHTGGIVGAGFSMSRMVSPGMFAGAPRFHTGGVIGADEVPIIAQRGEGVFTKEQMKAMGGASGSQIVTIAPTIQVNANGGTPQQNADLAAQTAKAAEGAIRSIVVDEIMAQRRPGNMLNG
ncbi:tape measure protein [Methylobacterium sp. AMS5]|uniref:tape measure protein n=1 Tax=Methylobacterium sp. AMS5 TaxID=925818 RepID=UPI00074F9DD1|nr:tape measure protein [Methylobacterium sp. AMS5]AMB48259.1 hypothetical protein Y590_25160 [Methylobacterium sp. AMS5]